MTPSAPAPTAAQRLAAAAAATRWRGLPDDIRRQARDLVLDTFANITAASVHPAYRPWIDALGGERGRCTIIGRARPVPAATAALANGGATTVLQWQDGHRMARGHPASQLVPVLLALGETLDVSGEAFMSAFVAGYEVGTRIGIALGGLKEDIHDSGTWATIGAAAAAAKLLAQRRAGRRMRSEAEVVAAIARAIDGAAAVAPLPQRDTCWRGAEVHHLYVGLGANVSLGTARAAVDAGFGAIDGTLEDFFGPRAGLDFRRERLVAGLAPMTGQWLSYELMQAYFKWHPVCAHFSGLADALIELQQEFAHERGRRMSREEIEAVEVALYRVALHFDAEVPANDLAARFSARAVVFAALDPAGAAEPRIVPEDGIRAARAADEAVRAWMARVRVIHDPRLDESYPGGRPARVTLRLADGTTWSRRVDHPYGDSERPMSGDDRRHKRRIAFACARGANGADVVESAFDRFVAGEPIAVLSRALRGGGETDGV